MNAPTRTAAVTAALTAGSVLALAVPASAATSSKARCMGEAVSYGATTMGPRAVADHTHAAKAFFAEELGLSYGQVARTVASLEAC